MAHQKENQIKRRMMFEQKKTIKKDLSVSVVADPSQERSIEAQVVPFVGAPRTTNRTSKQ